MTRDIKVESRAVKEILWRDWDPIGCGVPDDEYDAYVLPIYGMLIHRASRAEIAARLIEFADEHIGCPVPQERLESVLDKLFALKLATT